MDRDRFLPKDMGNEIGDNASVTSDNLKILTSGFSEVGGFTHVPMYSSLHRQLRSPAALRNTMWWAPSIWACESPHLSYFTSPGHRRAEARLVLGPVDTLGLLNVLKGNYKPDIDRSTRVAFLIATPERFAQAMALTPSLLAREEHARRQPPAPCGRHTGQC